MIELLEQCIKCTQANKSRDLNPQLAKIHMLMADVYHLAEVPSLEANELHAALSFFKKESFAILCLDVYCGFDGWP